MTALYANETPLPILFVTVLLGGGAAWLAGRAIAQTWRPMWHVVAYMALLDTLAAQGKSIQNKIDGYTEAQRYFLSFAQVWCENRTDQSARLQ